MDVSPVCDFKVKVALVIHEFVIRGYDCPWTMHWFVYKFCYPMISFKTTLKGIIKRPNLWFLNLWTLPRRPPVNPVKVNLCLKWIWVWYTIDLWIYFLKKENFWTSNLILVSLRLQNHCRILSVKFQNKNWEPIL